MFGARIGAGACILCGLFVSKKQKTETTVDYVKMAQNAEAAGFNPLTALRNGGSAGFTSTVHHPGLSALGNGIANAGASFGAALDARMDPIRQQNVAQQADAQNHRLVQLQLAPKQQMIFGDVPTRTGRNVTITPKPAMSAGAKASAGVSTKLLSSASANGGYFTPPQAAEADLPIWVPGRDRDGKRVWIPNPDGPDIEQALYAWSTRPIAVAEAFAKTAVDLSTNFKGQFKVKKATPAETKKANESWHGGWLPSLGLKW